MLRFLRGGFICAEDITCLAVPESLGLCYIGRPRAASHHIALFDHVSNTHPLTFHQLCVLFCFDLSLGRFSRRYTSRGEKRDCYGTRALLTSVRCTSVAEMLSLPYTAAAPLSDPALIIQRQIRAIRGKQSVVGSGALRLMSSMCARRGGRSPCSEARVGEVRGGNG